MGTNKKRASSKAGDAASAPAPTRGPVAERITEALHDPLLILEHDFRVRSANAAFREHFGVGSAETVGRRLYDVGDDGLWEIAALRTLLEQVLPEVGHFEGFEIEHEFDGLGRRTLILNVRRLAGDGLILLGIRDITERKRDERTLRETQARLAEELRASRRLHAMLARTFRARGLDEMLDEVLQAAIDLQGADFGNIQLVRDDGTLEIANQVGLSSRFLEAFRTVRADDDTACGRALRSRSPVLVGDVTRDEALALLQDVFAEADVRAVLSVPLVARSGQALGVLSTHFREPRAWSERDAQSMIAVARQSADVLERLRSEELLRQLADGLEERVEERTREVRELASTLTMAEQEERRRISGILHDDLQQLLYGIQMRLALARAQADTGDSEALLAQTDEALRLLGEAVSRTRRLTVDLSPPVLDGESFVEAMQWIQTQMRGFHGLDVAVEGDPGLDVASRELHILLFHVVRELLFNVAKHAHTRHARVEVEQRGDMLWITVEDQGRGFEPDALRPPERNLAGGFGLFSARERLRLHGGGMEIESRPGEGARISIYAPISSSS